MIKSIIGVWVLTEAVKRMWRDRDPEISYGFQEFMKDKNISDNCY